MSPVLGANPVWLPTNAFVHKTPLQADRNLQKLSNSPAAAYGGFPQGPAVPGIPPTVFKGSFCCASPRPAEERGALASTANVFETRR